MTVVNTLFVLFSCISDFKPKFTRRLHLLLCFLYSWFLGWLIVFILSFFFSAPCKLAFLTHSIFCLLLCIFPFLFFHHLSHVLFCLSMLHQELFLPFSFFFFGWRAEVDLKVGGRWLSVGEGGKGPVKQRGVVCWQGRQETQISQDSPPVAAPWLSCWPTADWGWQPHWAPVALCHLSILPYFLLLGSLFFFSPFSCLLFECEHIHQYIHHHLEMVYMLQTTPTNNKSIFKLHRKLSTGYFEWEYKD